MICILHTSQNLCSILQQISIIQQSVVQLGGGGFHFLFVAGAHRQADLAAQLFQLPTVFFLIQLGNYVLFGLDQHLKSILVFLRALQVGAFGDEVFVDAFHLDDLGGVHLVFAGLLNGKSLLVLGEGVVN